MITWTNKNQKLKSNKENNRQFKNNRNPWYYDLWYNKKKKINKIKLYKNKKGNKVKWYGILHNEINSI